MVEKTYKLSDLKLVKVEWLDAMSDDNTWQERNYNRQYNAGWDYFYKYFTEMLHFYCCLLN